MLTTVHAARGLAILINWMWPSCRLPIVGTKTLFGSCCKRRSRLETEWMTSTRRAPRSSRKRVLGTGKGSVLHFLHVQLHRLLYRAGEDEIVLDELRLPARENVEHVVEHEHLPRAVDAGADADGGN